MRAATGLAILGAMLGGLAFVACGKMSSDQRAKLIADVRRVRPLDRRCHLDVCTAGSFGEAVDRWKAAAPTALLALDKPAQADLAKLPLPVVRSLIVSSRAEHLGVPRGLGFLAADPSWAWLLYPAKAAAIIAPTLAPLEGASVCTDTIAFGRDVMLLGNMVADMVGASIVESAVRACRAVFARMPEDARGGTRDALTRIATGYPAFATIVEREAVEMRVRALGELLTTEERAGLPEVPLLDTIPTTSPLRRLFGWYDSMRLEAYLALFVAAHRADDRTRPTRLAQLPPPPLGITDDFTRYRLRHESVRGELDALIAELAPAASSTGR